MLLWNRRSAFLQYCTLLFQKSECSDSPSDMAGQSWHVPTVQVHMCVVMYNVHTWHRHRSWPCGSTGPVPEARQKNVFQNCATRDIWNPSYQKKFWKIFFRAWKNVCHAGGRATPRVPHPRSQGQLAAAYTMVQSCYCKLCCGPGSSVGLENRILLIGI